MWIRGNYCISFHSKEKGAFKRGVSGFSQVENYIDMDILNVLH